MVMDGGEDVAEGIGVVVKLVDGRVVNVMGGMLVRGNVKKKSLFKDIIHISGWVVKAFSKFF